MRPDNKPQSTNRDNRPYHGQIAKYGLARKGCDYVANQAKSGKDDNVNLWMSKEPQNMLVQYWVSATGRIKEGCAKVTIRQQHGDRASKNRKRQQYQPACHED